MEWKTFKNSKEAAIEILPYSAGHFVKFTSWKTAYTDETSCYDIISDIHIDAILYIPEPAPIIIAD